MRWRPAREHDAAWDARLTTSWSHVEPTWGATAPSPLFTPDHLPPEMAKLGVFGDAYWGGPAGRERAAMLVGTAHVVGPEDLRRGPREYTNIRGNQTAHVNYYGRAASLSKDWWLDRGLINVFDPLGWYEWFWWYWLGRRILGYDDWQIARWENFKLRHVQMYQRTPVAGHAQALLHWGIRPPNPVDSLVLSSYTAPKVAEEDEA